MKRKTVKVPRPCNCEAYPFCQHGFQRINWEQRVQKLEEEGLTRSDAQAVVDAEDRKERRPFVATHLTKEEK